MYSAVLVAAVEDSAARISRRVETADMAPEEAARKVAEALNTIWDFKQHQDKIVKELGELRARAEELEAETKLYGALIDAVVKYIPETLEGVVKEVAQIASYKNPNAVALQLALAEEE